MHQEFVINTLVDFRKLNVSIQCQNPSEGLRVVNVNCLKIGLAMRKMRFNLDGQRQFIATDGNS